MANTIKNRNFWTELIQLYKEHPCLWDPQSAGYHKKPLKDLAFNLLLEKYRELDGSANMETIRKKILLLRSGFCREYKKVQDAGLAGTTYVSKLWYYPHFKFLKGNNQDKGSDDDEVSNRESPEPSRSDVGVEEHPPVTDQAHSAPSAWVVPSSNPDDPVYQSLPKITGVSSIAEKNLTARPSTSRTAPISTIIDKVPSPNPVDPEYQSLPKITSVSSIAEDKQTAQPSTSRTAPISAVIDKVPSPDPVDPVYQSLPKLTILSTISEDKQTARPSTSRSAPISVGIDKVPSPDPVDPVYQSLPKLTRLSSIAENKQTARPSTSRTAPIMAVIDKVACPNPVDPVYPSLPKLTRLSSIAEDKQTARPSTSRTAPVSAVIDKVVKDHFDDCSTFAAHIKIRMRRFDKAQKVIAQKLISDILFMADTKQLNLASAVVNPQAHAAQLVQATQVPQAFNNYIPKTAVGASFSAFVIDSDDDDGSPMIKRQK